MVTEQTLAIARETVAELRRRGQSARADAVAGQQAAGTGETADLFGVDGPTLKRWVAEGRCAGYRVGELLTVPREIVEEYVRRAASSLDLEDVSDEEAARVVEEGRRQA